MSRLTDSHSAPEVMQALEMTLDCAHRPARIAIVAGPAGHGQNLVDILSAHHSVVITTSIQENLIRPGSQNPLSLVIVDGRKPGHSALAACRAIRRVYSLSELADNPEKAESLIGWHPAQGNRRPGRHNGERVHTVKGGCP